MDRSKVVEVLLNILINDLGLISDKDELQMDNSFRDNNMDSLDEVEVVMRVEKDLNIHINDNAFADINTPNQLVDYIVKKTEFKPV